MHIRRFDLAVQKSRALVYNLAWVIGVSGKLAGILDFSWPEAFLFFVVANGSALLCAGLSARGITQVAGLSLRLLWMAADVGIITWAIFLSGGSSSAWYPWYLSNAAAAAYIVGRRGLVAVIVADMAAYLGLVVLTENPEGSALLMLAGKLVILFGAAWYALDAITRLQEKRRTIADLREADIRRAAELEKAIETMARSAEGLGAAADSLSSVSQKMTENAGTTASRAGTVLVAARQVSANAAAVADSAEEMGAGVRSIAHSAREAAEVATSAVEVAEGADLTMIKLTESSSAVKSVIKVITSIAEQTRTLALNATIEAARSGEAGKGFAVVAAEVKELARATATAADDIGSKITTIRADAEEAVGAIGRIRDTVQQIHELQNTIASAVEEQTATTNAIVGNVTEAARGGSEIVTSITAMADAAQETSSGASAAREAARQLARMAEELKRA